jgi:predicted RNA-binding Zn ribbon-like protein
MTGGILTSSKEQAKIVRRRPPQFDLIAGNVCLDFVNTLDDRYTKPKELLGDYLDLARFAEDTGLLDSQTVDQLFARSQADPERAQQVLMWARELRETIHEVFRAIIDQRPVPQMALARLNGFVQSAAEHMRLVAVKGSFAWSFEDRNAFESMLWPIARAAADLLTSEQLPYVRACFSKTCEWFFLDTSKNHHRRWCDMTSCGNRAKLQRFYARRKSSNS